MSYSTHRQPGRPAEGIADTIAGAVAMAAGGAGVLRAPPSLQSWPGIVHGGGVVALLDCAAQALGGTAGPRKLEARLTASVPIDTSLRIEGRADADAIRVAILEGEQML